MAAEGVNLLDVIVGDGEDPLDCDGKIVRAELAEAYFSDCQDLSDGKFTALLGGGEITKCEFLIAARAGAFDLLLGAFH